MDAALARSARMWKRLWLSLQGPRWVTALQTAIYALGIAMGAVTILMPPVSLAAVWGSILTQAWALILAIGSALGLAGCTKGWWWLEIRGLWLIWLGIGLYLGIVVGLHITSPGNRLTQAIALLILLLFFVTRWLRIRDFALDPTRGRDAATDAS